MTDRENQIITKPLQKKLTNRFNTAPFLFIGSGLSQRYLGLEDWEQLLKKFCDTNKPYNYYSTLANNKLEEVGEFIANDFHEIWWTDDEYVNEREEFGDTLKTKQDPLKLEISNYIKSNSDSFEIQEPYKEEIKALRDSTVDGIITTNYDLLLENIFPDFEVFIGQDDMIFSNRQSIGEIYKIHGCCTEPSSIVLTKSDYKRFREVNTYLASVLLEIFLEHPIFFLGYSMSDSNITQILNNISKCLGGNNLNELAERLHFVNWIGSNSDDISIQKTIKPIEGLNIPITMINASSFTPIFKSFQNIKRKIPVRTLRICKEQLYELVKTNDPDNQLFVSDIEEADSKDIEFAIGIGTVDKLTKLGYEELETEKLFEDVIFGKYDFDPDKLLEKTIPNKLKRSAYIPFYKYLNELDIFSDQQYVESKFDLDKGMNLRKINFAPGKKTYRRYKDKLKDKTIAGLVEDNGIEDASYLIPMLPNEQLDIENLHEFIKNNFDLINHDKNSVNLGIRKCIVLYDRLKYGWQNL